MKRFLSTRFGFFGLAAVVCFVMYPLIEPEHRWVSPLIGGLYVLLSLGFYFDELGSTRPRDIRHEQMTLFDPPLPPRKGK
jgi:hypothetical protein